MALRKSAFTFIMHMGYYGLSIPMRQLIVEQFRENKEEETLCRLFCVEIYKLAARQRGYDPNGKIFKRKETAYAIHHVIGSGNYQQPLHSL